MGKLSVKDKIGRLRNWQGKPADHSASLTSKRREVRKYGVERASVYSVVLRKSHLGW